MSSQNILQQIKKLPLPFTSESRSPPAPHAIALGKKFNKQKLCDRQPTIPTYKDDLFANYPTHNRSAIAAFQKMCDRTLPPFSFSNLPIRAIAPPQPSLFLPT